MKCMHCEEDFEENIIEVHHIHPKFMDNKNGNGMKLNLCHECHMMLHLKIPAMFWRFLDPFQKSLLKDLVINEGKKWGNLK